jgi:hypothetical protein
MWGLEVSLSCSCRRDLKSVRKEISPVSFLTKKPPKPIKMTKRKYLRKYGFGACFLSALG